MAKLYRVQCMICYRYGETANPRWPMLHCNKCNVYQDVCEACRQLKLDGHKVTCFPRSGVRFNNALDTAGNQDSGGGAAGRGK